MREEGFVKERRAQTGTNEGGWKPSMAGLLGLALSVVLLVGSIILGVTTGIGLLFAIPLAVLAIGIAVVVLRGRASPESRTLACPACGARVRAASHIAETACPSCGRRIETGARGDD